MTQTVEVSIAEILTKLDAKIDAKFDLLDQKIDKKFDSLDGKIDKLSVEMAKIDGKLSGIDKRVENLEFIARTVGGGIVVALLLGLAKFLFPNFGI